MRPMRGHPLVVLVLAWLLAFAAGAVMAEQSGWHAVGGPLSVLRPWWVAAAVVAQFLALLAYVPAYRVMAGLDGGPDVSRKTAAQLVFVGFAAFAPAGGFVYDQRVWASIDHDRRAAGARVLGLGALEYAILAPAAWLGAVVLLPEHSHVQRAVLLPWALCVPLGTLLALLAVRNRDALSDRGRRRHVGQSLKGIEHLLSMRRDRARALVSAAGMFGYWLAEAISLYAAGRSVGLSLTPVPLVLGMATGFALTRRSMPLAGAGVTMVLMSLALHWVGAPLGLAVATTIVYGAVALVLPSLAALPARRALEHRGASMGSLGAQQVRA
jgi:uncharacterized membrane protein YbhN (UPF0104 family)